MNVSAAEGLFAEHRALSSRMNILRQSHAPRRDAINDSQLSQTIVSWFVMYS